MSRSASALARPGHLAAALVLLAATAPHVADGMRVAPVPDARARASPQALRALRDIALVGEHLRELEAAVQPAAEFGAAMVPLETAAELSELSSSFRSGTTALYDSLGALSTATTQQGRAASLTARSSRRCRAPRAPPPTRRR